MRGWEDGKMGRWEDGKMGRWEDGKMVRWSASVMCPEMKVNECGPFEWSSKWVNVSRSTVKVEES